MAVSSFRGRRIDLKGLARTLGLSVTTVSRALNGYDDVSPRTRERVERAARELGYTPNALARRLTSGRAETVAFIPQAVEPCFESPYVAELLVGIGEALHRSNFDLVLAGGSLSDDPLAACRRLVEEGRVDGMILDRTFVDDPRVAYLLDQRFPFVTLGRDRWCARHAWLDSDGERAFYALTRALVRAGHRRIAFIGADPRFNFLRTRERGYRRALREAGVGWDPDLVRYDGFSEGGGAEACRALLRLAEPPTAILCIEDLTALGAMQAVWASGRRPGWDVAVVGYNDTPLAAAASPSLSSFRLPVRAAGRRLADMVLAIVQGTPADRHQELWVPQFIARSSHHWREEREAPERLLNLPTAPG